MQKLKSLNFPIPESMEISKLKKSARFKFSKVKHFTISIHNFRIETLGL